MNRDTNTTPLYGPYATEADAHQAAAPLYEAARLDRQRGSMTRANRDALCTALSRAGVELGAYDDAITYWVSGWEPETVTVIIGWIARAGGAR